MTATATACVAVRNSMAALLQTSLGDAVKVVEIEGKLTRETVGQRSISTPGVLLAITDGRNAKQMGHELEVTYLMQVIVVTKNKSEPGKKARLGASDAFWAIEQAIRITLATQIVDDSKIAVDHEKVISADLTESGDSVGLGFMEWPVTVDLPPQVNAEELAATLADLKILNADLDFAHAAPDGSDAPDGVVDHTTRVTGLDQDP